MGRGTSSSGHRPNRAALSLSACPIIAVSAASSKAGNKTHSSRCLKIRLQHVECLLDERAERESSRLAQGQEYLVRLDVAVHGDSWMGGLVAEAARRNAPTRGHR